MESWERNSCGNSSELNIGTFSCQQYRMWFLSLAHYEEITLFQLRSVIKSGFRMKCTLDHLICEKASVPWESRHAQINSRLQCFTGFWGSFPGPRSQFAINATLNKRSCFSAKLGLFPAIHCQSSRNLFKSFTGGLAFKNSERSQERSPFAHGMASLSGHPWPLPATATQKRQTHPF